MNTPIQALMQQKALLQVEYACEKESFRRQTEATGMARKVKRGDAWYPVTAGRSYYNSLNQPCVEIVRQQDDDIEHNFEFGRPVMFFTTTSAPVKNEQTTISYLSFTATVSYADGGRMVVTLPDMSRAVELQQPGAPLGVQLSFDETSYRLMFEALDRAMRAKGNRLAYLRDLFYTPTVKPQHFAFAPMRFPWLNATQEKAVNEVLWTKDVMVVHGPPGTGKTTTLVEAIHETLQRESQVLVCAQSNMAVDWIAEKLVDRGISVLRIGNPTRVNDKMLSFTYERRFEAHPDYPQLWSLRKAMRELRSQRKRSDSWHQKMERLKSRATELELRINAELFGEARVIASTLTGAANRLLDGMKFGTLFIDEAGDIPAPMQIKLLRVFQDHRFMRVGGEEERHSDFRLICATNKDLWAEVKSGHFREDLYYRLSVVPLTIPPLRSRKEDIRLLVRFFLDRYSRRYHRDIQQPSERELEALLQYDWPGNIRELKSVLERTVILHQGGRLSFDLSSHAESKADGTPRQEPCEELFKNLPTLDELQSRYIQHVLKITNGRITGNRGALRILGMKRSTLYLRLKQYNIRF